MSGGRWLNKRRINFTNLQQNITEKAVAVVLDLLAVPHWKESILRLRVVSEGASS
jgi:hypothetical protein